MKELSGKKLKMDFNKMVGYVFFFKFAKFVKTKIYISKVYFLCLRWFGTLKILLTSLAHLWGANAIPCLSSIVRCVSSVSTITTRNN